MEKKLKQQLQDQNRNGSNENSKGSYEDDLWDQLPVITKNHKRGVQLLTGFSTFCKSYTKVLQNFSNGLQKCGDQFEKDMRTEHGFDTTAIAISTMKQGLDDISRQINAKINKLVGDIIEPLEQYQKHYVQTSYDQMIQAKAYWNNLEEEKNHMLLLQDKYYRLMNDAELSEISIEKALLEHEKGTISLEQVQKITNQTLNIKYKAEIASQEYKKEVDHLNKHLAKFEDDYKPLLQRLQQGEESRINFLKYNFEKFIKHLNLMGKYMNERSTELQNSVTMINSETDLKIFIDEHKSNHQFSAKIEYKPYEFSPEMQKQKGELINQINQQKIANNLQQLEEERKKNEINEEQLVEYLHMLMRGQDIPFDAKSEIISSLHNQKVRDTVAEYLKGVNSPKTIENGEALKTLGELLKYMLTAYVHEKDENYKVIYSILHCSQQVFHVKINENGEKQKVFLTNYLNDHGIWQEQHIWKVCISKIINQKFHEAIQSPGVLSAKSQQIQQPQVIPSPSSGSLFGSLGKLKGLWGQSKDEPPATNQSNGNKQTLRIPKTLAQNIIFNSLSKFLYHFVNFQLPFETAKEILLFFCNKYQLDQNRTHLLLSELESIQKKSRFAITHKELLEISKRKQNNIRDKFGSEIEIIIGLSLKYIDSDYTLRNCLVLNKQTKTKLSQVVYKQALIFSQNERIRIKRIPIWENLLKLVRILILNCCQNENKSDYNAFKNKVLQNIGMIQNVEEVINMDVQRSFTKTKEIDPVVLTNILKTYAFFNPEIEYCQGMNFIAGFLQLVFKDEEKSFKALQHIVSANDMAELFNTELPKLKLFFYQFDRLVSIQLPQLHSHFKDEMINSSYYSSAWFITIFTNSLQNQEGHLVCEKLLELWDYFLTSGWKAIFKMGLYVLKENAQELLRMNFEQILNFITEKPKQMLSEYQTPNKDDIILYHELKSSTKDMIHLNYILERLEREFKESLEAASQFKGGSPDKRSEEEELKQSQ